MKNKKGFTLVELMAVIVVLAIIIAIAVPVYNKIKINIDKKSYENKIELIEVAASKYAEDTNYEVMFVDDLIKAGYLDADKENGDILNDLTKDRINCNIVKLKKENGIYYATFLDDKSYEENGTCDINALNKYNETLNIVMYEYENETKGNEIKYDKIKKWWTKTDVILEAKINLNEKDIESIKWYKGYSQEILSTEKIITVTSNSVLQENYKVVVKTKDNKEYSSTVRVYIDKIKPKFYSNMNNQISKEWVTEDKYNINGYDNESGIYGYYIDENITVCPIDNQLYKDPKKQTFENNGTYKVCAMDNVGNVSEKVGEITIDKVDNQGDSCNIDVTGSYVNVNGKDWYYTDTYLTVTVIPQYKSANGKIENNAGAIPSQIVVSNSNEDTATYALKDNKYKFKLKNTGSNNISIKTKDSVGNEKTDACKISINLDSIQPKITAKAASQILAYGANKPLLDLFTVSTNYGPTGGTTTCYYVKSGNLVSATNNNELILGKNTIKCQMVGKNSKKSEATTIIYHTKTTTKFTCPSGYTNTGTTCKKCTGTGNKVVKC